MDYKTSLLIYKTQTINSNNIWKSKIRLIKKITPLFRLMSDADFKSIEDFNASLLQAGSLLENNINNLNNSKNGVSAAAAQAIDNQINDLKINFLEIKSSLSNTYKNDKIHELESYTRMLVLLYCTWSEASLLKLKHTPHGLSIAERSMDLGKSVENKWSKLIDIILDKIPIQNSGDISHMKNDLKAITEEYIKKPSILRNKIAHGQWIEAMNRDNDDLNFDLSFELSTLDIVKVDFSFNIHNHFLEILESILESNDTASMIINRHDSYLFLKEKLDKFILTTQNWNSHSRSTFLKQRTFDTRNLELSNLLKTYNIDENIIFEITQVTK